MYVLATLTSVSAYDTLPHSPHVVAVVPARASSVPLPTTSTPNINATNMSCVDDACQVLNNIIIMSCLISHLCHLCEICYYLLIIMKLCAGKLHSQHGKQCAIANVDL